MEIDEETRKQIIKEAMSANGKKRWAKMSKEERSEYGKKLAKARWNKERK